MRTVELPQNRQRMTATLAVAGLVALAIWIRMQFIVLLGGLEPSYLDWASRNYFGGITLAYLNGADAILDLRPFPSLGYPPGYAGIIAALQALGLSNLQDLRIAQACLEAFVGVIATYRILRVAGTVRLWGLVGAGFYAVYPPLAAGGGLILAEGWSPALLLVSLNGAAWVARRPTARRLAIFGFGLGAVSLVRPDLVLLGGPLGLWLWWFGRVAPRPQNVAALAAGFLIALTPWGLHNRIVHGAWVFTSTGGSAGLWEGLGIIENPYGYVLSDEKTMALLRSKGLGWHSVEADRFLRQDYLRAWREHPDFVVRAAAYRWTQILWKSEQFQPPVFRPLQDLLDQFGLWIVLAAVVVGAAHGGTWLVAVIPVTYALIGIGMVHYEPRYVRYVHLAYFLAFIVAVDRSLVRVRRIPQLSTIAGLAFVTWAAVESVSQFALLRDQLKVARFELMVRGANRSGLQVVEPPPGATWKLSPGVQHRLDGATDVFATTPLGMQYIASREYTVTTGAMLVVDYDVSVDTGSVTVGMLDSAGNWMQIRNVHAGGRQRGSFVGEVKSGSDVSLLLAGANRTDSPVQFTLHSLVLSSTVR